MVDKVCDVDLFDEGTKVAIVGSLLVQGWVLLKDSLVGPWGVFTGRFHLKYTHMHIRNLSYKFEDKTTHKIYQGTL